MKAKTAIGLALAAALAAGAAWRVGKNDRAQGGSVSESSGGGSIVAGAAVAADTVPRDERARAWQTAIEKGKAEAPTWPQTPEALIREFWLAASRKDYDRMQLLCPGSVAGDFKKYYDRWTPSPATAVGAPVRHPRDPQLTLYPATVPFPGFPNKTVKMAVKKIDDGRLVIDGAGTIWW